MSKIVCQFSFNIAAWHAACSKFATPEQWQQWANDEHAFADAPEYKPALAFLPAMQRRRLGKAARLVCEAAWDLADRYPNSPLVYASHDGELNRSFDLWPELLRSQTVSPTSFGLSVHNALAGQLSMLRGDMSESTALALGSDGIETAFAEAFSLLQDGAESVLLIIADDPLAEQYPLPATRAPFAYALAMVLTAGEDYRLSLEMPSENTASENELIEPYWSALDWIRFMLSDGIQHTQTYRNRTWQWQKS